ncbi:hypothetical protein [Clostridium felsineum]|uniref:Uncharacterized protein n=1 Tax=Clostridium felsineum TaxID=36839 RepID=A0A1S8MEY7_9CLOT|nr:hypothetical protein [Clostridium felsineum]URZ09255.1 hypothetical protein CLROS_046710 [Clostridium felsineum]URZ13941.1 hypothetical protein CROST_047190 [Clostridium felsineum]
MGKQLLQLNQIAGIHRDTLYNEIVDVIEKSTGYKDPVNLIGDLPTANNADGDIRLVVSQDLYYMWDVSSNTWSINRNISVEEKIIKIPIQNDNQNLFKLPLSLGILEGIASINSIDVVVNGSTQTKDVDYDIIYDTTSKTITLNWLSKDFSLEVTDALELLADILIN